MYLSSDCIHNINWMCGFMNFTLYPIFIISLWSSIKGYKKFGCLTDNCKVLPFFDRLMIVITVSMAIILSVLENVWR